MRAILTLLALLIGGTAAAVVDNGGGTPPDAAIPVAIDTPMTGKVIDKAMHWLGEHPASIRENELMEVVEEVMFFYALRSAPGYEAERPYFLREIASRHQAIVEHLAETGDTQQHLLGDWAALTYPPLAHILSETGFETAQYRELIDELISRKKHLEPSRSAMRLWITIYLERLDLATESSVRRLLNSSPLQQDPDTHVLLDYFSDHAAANRNQPATVQLVYNITHEIIALTDFGALPPPPVMLAQHAHYARLLDAAISWATQASALDVLAELVFCTHLLGVSDLPALPAAVALITSRQQEDGSFGITNPDRPDGRRHGVLTSLLALKTLSKNSRAAGRL